MTIRVLGIPLTLVAGTMIAGACSDGGTGPTSNQLPEPSNFVATVTNPFFPLTPGTTYFYESADGAETNTVAVLSEKKTILSISATIVHDQVFTAGELTE